MSLAAPRFWHGMRMSTYFKLLWRGGFRIHFLGIAMAIAICVYSVFNSVLSFMQALFLGRRIAKTEIKEPPVFIIGHWRSGTTLVHELMSLDENLRAPDTYECFAPSHFLFSSGWLKPLIGLVMPRTRPMDNMESGVSRPQEDEFAICALGAPSPYLAMAFPNQPRPHQEMIDMVGISEADRAALAKTMNYFAKALTYRHGKRLVFKSPTHTGRVEFLRELFPGAKFIHITRDPKDVIPSTIRLWTRLDRFNGFQIPAYEPGSLEEYVGQTYARMHQALELQTKSKQDDLIDLRYEELVRNPIEALGKAYEAFDLPGFEKVKPKIEEFMKSRSDYKRNQHQISSDIEAVIDKYCDRYRKKYGYES